MTNAFNSVKPTQRIGYLSFAVLHNHVDQGRLQPISNVLTYFRNYLQYHIKSSKTYFHSRMRARVANTLKLLNRAKQENNNINTTDSDIKHNKKTITGRTFNRIT